MAYSVRVVVDTNIFVSAVLRTDTAPREVIRQCLQGEVKSLMGMTLFFEYEAVLSPAALFKNSPLKKAERRDLLDAFMVVSQWTPVYYRWRPNLRDEADNHLIELAVAGNVKYIITRNKKDFINSELIFPDIHIVNAGEFLKERR